MKNRELKGQLEKAKGGYTITASTSGVDRDGERILPEAWKKSLKPYLKNNPVILWAHDYKKPPIAKATGGRITDAGLNLDIEFADTEAGREIKSLYDGGFMNSFSVGFIPNDGQAGKGGVFEYTDVELLEVSAVPVPANPEANMIRAAELSGMKLTALKSWYNIDDEEQEEAAGFLQEQSAKGTDDGWSTGQIITTITASTDVEINGEKQNDQERITSGKVERYKRAYRKLARRRRGKTC